jgi:hypothetical protein
MKKLILLLSLLITFSFYSQSKSSKNCDCCPKKTTKIVHKKPIKKKPKVVKPIVKDTKKDSNIIINNIINCPTVTPIEKVTIKTDTIIKIVKYVPEPVILKRDLPIYEVYGGVVKPNNISTLGYIIGFNILPNLHQIDKNGKEREYFNKLLFGIEFSGYGTDRSFTILPPEVNDTEVKEDCNCSYTLIPGINTPGDYNLKASTKGITINFGTEVYKGWFLLTGVTGLSTYLRVNGDRLGTNRTFYINGGVSKFIQYKNTFWSPSIKFNAETVSLGLGFSYN